MNNKNICKILVTDGLNENALAVVRNLGNKHSIGVSSHSPLFFSTAAVSRYTCKRHRLKSVKSDIDEYAADLIGIIKEYEYDCIIPVGLLSYLAVSKYKDEFQMITHVAISAWDNMQLAYNRDCAIGLANREKIPIPRSYFLHDSAIINSIENYPVVFKTSDYYNNLVKYCNSRMELEQEIVKGGGYRQGIIAQEHIKGFGCGYYGIYDKGEEIAYFLHRRISEYPVTGGSSAIAESYYDQRIRDYGTRLCRALSWHGPIMVEFKYDYAHDDYKLIEINPKLWGSLDLTIAAGVAVPELLVNIALGKRTLKQNRFSYVRYTWVFPNQWKVLISEFSKNNLCNLILAPFRGKTNLNFRDPIPMLIQLGKSLWFTVNIFLNPKKRYPHGKVR